MDKFVGNVVKYGHIFKLSFTVTHFFFMFSSTVTCVPIDFSETQYNFSMSMYIRIVIYDFSVRSLLISWFSNTTEYAIIFSNTTSFSKRYFSWHFIYFQFCNAILLDMHLHLMVIFGHSEWIGNNGRHYSITACISIHASKYHIDRCYFSI